MDVKPDLALLDNDELEPKLMLQNSQLVSVRITMVNIAFFGQVSMTC